jgi:hypothetical protein
MQPKHVTEIVQQRSCHKRIRGTVGFGEGRRLQRMLQLRHRLAAIWHCTITIEQQSDVFHLQ